MPEAYRERFRVFRKTMSQTSVDYAHEKGLFFDRWCAACRIKDQASLRELIVLEEFKNRIHEKVAIYLNEQKMCTLQQTAVLASEFSLTRKLTFSKCDPSAHHRFPQKADSAPTSCSPPSSSISKSERKCFFCFKPGHLIAD